MSYSKKDLLFLPLGGANEIGMNVNLYHLDGKWLMVDLGAGFAALGVAFFATAFAALGVALATAFAALGLALAGFASSILSTLSSNPIISHQLYIAPITR